MSHRRSRAFIVLALVLALLAGAGIGLYYKGPESFRSKVDTLFGGEEPRAENAVGPEGRTVTFDDGVIITVPKGAVSKESVLQYGSVRRLASGDAGPLKGHRSDAYSFDVSLLQDGKEVQPKKALVLTTPSREGTPFAYTYTGDKKLPYALLNTKRGKGTVTIALPHLSPKALTYLSDKDLLSLFHEEAAIQDRGTCKQEVKVGGTKVRMGQKQGRSLDDDSAIFACLVAGSGTANVGIVNRIDYTLKVAASDSFRVVDDGGGAKDRIIEDIIHKGIFPDARVKALLSSGEKLVAEVPVDNLPATIEVKSDPDTFLSEAVYNSVGFLASIALGKGLDEVADFIGAITDKVEIIDCLRTAVENVNSDSHVERMTRIAYDCTGVIGGAIADEADLGWWRLDFFIGAAQILIDTSKQAFNGIRLELNGTMRIPVEAVTPPLSPYVGDWRVHGSMLHINEDGTGWQRWNAGPCSSTIDVGMCTGFTPLKARAVRGGVYVERTADATYKTSDGDSFVPDDVKEYGEERKAGDSTTLIRISDTLYKSSKSQDGYGDGFGNPYICRSVKGVSPEADEGKCGA